MHVLQPKVRRRLPKEVAQQTRLKQHRRRVKALPTSWIQSTSGCPASTRGCPWSRSCTVNLNPWGNHWNSETVSFSSHKKKRENKCIQELEETIKTLEESYVSSQEQEMLKKICKAKLELNEIINKKTKFLAQRLRWQEFEYGNKSGQFLANQLKINKEKTTICAVKDLSGDTVYDPERINNTFRDFTNLYILHR